jgi:putative ABC transport system permease protein
LGLKVGDSMSMRIAGRTITAEVANLRTIDWGGFGLNVAIVFSPGVLEGARPAHVALVKLPEDDEEAVVNAVGAALPEANIIRVREIYERATAIFSDVAHAISLATGLLIVTGALVVTGAFSAAADARRQSSALLKTLGMTRGAVTALFLGEFALVGAVTALTALLLGGSAAFILVTQVFEAAWRMDWMFVSGLILATTGVCALGGVLAARRGLSAPAARVLRGP